MTVRTHETLVADQFGPRAAAYLASAVHAAGADLDRLAEMVSGRTEARVLDLGCGGGHVGFRVAPHVREVVAYDLSAEMLAAVAGHAAAQGLGNLRTRQGPAEQLPFAAAEFDVVLCRFSAHHWGDLDVGLGEARRVLRPDGTAVFIDAIAPARVALDTHLQAIELLRDRSHVRDYSRREWMAALRAAGFVPGAAVERRLRLEFAAWIERMRTPQPQIAAIRSLQVAASAEVARHFAIEPDGSFTIDTMSVEAGPT